MTNITPNMFYNYLDMLISRVFKIIPTYENQKDTLRVYIQDLRDELIGFSELINILNNDAKYTSILATLQYLISNNYDKEVCKRYTFKCIALINKLKKKYIIL